MNFVRQLASFLVFIAFYGCLGQSNEELSKKTFGLRIEKVSGDGQVLENPGELASQELTVKVYNTNGEPLKNTTVTYTLINPDSGASLLDTNVTTDDTGVAKAKIKGGDDFGKKARVLVKVNQTSLETEFLVAIRDKIIPEFIKIVPPSDTVAGIPTSIQLRLEDRNGRLSFEDEFQTKVRVVFSSPSGNHTNASKFAPVPATERVVQFDGGIAWLNNVWAHKAEDISIQLEDAGDIAVLEDYINRPVDISDTQILKIVPAAPVRMALEDPADATTDDEVAVVAKLYDQYDNHAYNFANSCAVDIRLTGDRPEVKNTTYADPKTGRMNFASGQGAVTIFDTKVETVDITMESPVNCGAINSGNPSSYASAQDIYFGPGAPAQIVLMDPPMTTQSVDFPIPMSLEVQDAGGNHVSSYAGTVKVTLSGAESYIPTAGVVNNIVNIASGSATFDVRDKAVEQVVVGLEDVSATGMDVSSAKTLNFTVGAAKQFAFSAASFNGDADNGVNVDVEIWDQYGNRLTNWAGGSVNIVGTGNSDAAGAGKTLTFGPSETKKTINITDRTAENISLSFADAGSSLLESNDGSLEAGRTRFTAAATVKWGVVKKLEIEDPTDGTIDAPVNVTLKAMDNWGNIAMDYTNSDVRLNANKSATNSGVVAIVNGTGTRAISDLVNETVDLSMSLKAGVSELKNSIGENIDIVSSVQDVYFKWGAPTRFVLLDPADGTVDNPVEVIAQIKDQGNNLVKDYSGTIGIRVDKDAHHDSYLSGTKLKTLTFDGSTGVVSSFVYDQTAETVNVDLVDSGGSGLDLSAPQTVVFSPGAVVGYVFDTAPSATVDAPAALKIKSIDQFNNHNVSHNGTGVLSLRWVDQKSAVVDPNPADLSIDFNSGVGQISIADQTAETVRVGLAPKSGFDTSSELDIQFDPGVVTEIAILPPPAASITTDNPITVSLEAWDQYGNHNTSYEEDIAFLVNNNADIPGFGSEQTVDIVAGTGSVTVRDTVAETVALSMRDDAAPARGLTLTSVDVEFLPGTPARYKITSAPDGNVDNSVAIVIQSQDQHGNRVMAHQDDVKVLISEGTAALTNLAPDSNFLPDGTANQEAVVDIVNGQGSVYLTDRIAETAKIYLENTGGQTLNLVPGLADPHEGVIFSHGAPTKIEFLPLSTTPTTDGPFPVDVVARDKWNNLADTYDGDVSVRVNKNAVVAGSSDKVAKVIINNGEGSVSVEDPVVETGVLAVLGNELGSNVDGLNTSDTLLFNVTFGAPDYFAIIKPLTVAVTDSSFPINIEIRDKNHNVVTSGFNGDVKFKVSALSQAFIGSPGAQSVTVDFANNGNGVETVYVSDHKAEEVDLELEAILGQPVLNVNDKKFPAERKFVKFKAGAVQRFELVADTCSTVDTDCQVTVHAQDQYGNQNFEFGDSNAIKLAFNSGSAAYFVGGVSDVSFSSGEGVADIGDNKHETVTVSMANQTGGTYSFVNSYDIYFKYGAPFKYKFRAPGSTPTTDDPVLVEVEAQDQYGNLVEDYGSLAGQDVEMTVVSGSDSVTGAGVVNNFSTGVGSRSVAKTVVGTVTLGLANANDSLDVSDTLTLNFSHGAVDYFAFIDPGADWSVDNPHNLRIEARDKNHNLCSTYGGATKTVDLVFSAGGATGGGDGNYQFSNGYFEAALTNQTAEVTTMALQNPSTAGVDVTNTVDINWVAGAPAGLVVLAQGGPNYTVDDTPVMRVESQDQYGNFSDQFSGTATFSVNKNAFIYNSATPSDHSQTSKTLDFSTGSGGFVNVAIEDWSVETGVQVSVSGASDPAITVYTPALINFSHGSAAKYYLSSSDGTVDAPVQVDLEVHDRGGNVVQSMATHNIRLKTNKATTAFIPASGEVSVVNGQASLDLTSTVAEVVTVSIDTAAGAPVPQTSVTGVKTQPKFDPGFVTDILIASPANTEAGAPVNAVTLKAVDQYGNINNINGVTYNVDVIAKKDGTSTVRNSANVNVSGGQASITPSFTIAEDIRFSMANLSPLQNLAAQNIDFTSTSLTTIDPSTPDKLAFLPASNDTVDNFITITIQVQDQYGNKVVASSDQVAEFYLSSASGQAQFTPPQTNFSSGIFTIQSGEQSFKLYNTVAETVTVGMRIPGSNPPNTTSLTLDSDLNVTFLPGVPTKYAIVPPGSATVMDTPSFKVLVYDQYSNKVTSAGTAGSPGRVKINANIAGGSVDVEHQGATTTGVAELEVVSGEAVVSIGTTKAGTAKLQLTATDLTDPLNLIPDNTIHDVVFDAGPVDSIAMLDPVDDTVDTSGVDITLQSFDQYLNPTTSFAGQSLKVLVSGQAKFNGTTPAAAFKIVSFSGGIATAQVANQKAETVTLSLQAVDSYFSNNSIDISATQDLKFDPGAVTSLGIETALLPANPSVDTSVAGQNITVKAYDQYGNWQNLAGVANFPNELAVSVSSSAAKSYINSSSAQTTDTVDFSNGQANFTIHNPVAEVTTISLDSSASGFSLGGSATVTWTPGNVAYITMVDPTDVTVDDTATVNLEARDQYCNLNSAFGAPNSVKVGYSPVNIPETVTMSPATGNDVVFTSGGASFTVDDTKVETVTLTLSAGSSLGGGVATTSNCVSPTGVTYKASQDLDFGPGAPVKYQFSESTLIAGPSVNVDNPVNVEVKALDQYDNVVTYFTQANKLAITNDSSTHAFSNTPVSFVAGVGSFTVNDTTAGTFNLGMSLDAADTSLGILTDTTQIKFDHGAAKSFEIDVPPSNYTIDDDMIVTVRAVDQYGNFHNDYAGTVTTKTTSSFPWQTGNTSNKYSLGVSQVFSAGISQYSISSLKAETTPFKVTAADANSGGDPMTVNQQENITFTPGAGTQMQIQPTLTKTVDNVNTVTVHALDRGDNIAIGENGSNVATLTISGMNSSLCALNKPGETIGTQQFVDFDLVAGVGQVDIECQKVGVYTLTLSGLPGGWTVNGGTETIEFTPGVLQKVAFVSPTPSSSAADMTFTLGVEAQDQYGNLVDDYGGRVKIVDASSSQNVTIPSAGLGAGVIAFSGGLASLGGVQVTKAPQTVTFGFQGVSGYTIPDLTETADVVINHGAPASVSLASMSDKTAGETAQAKVVTYDTYGNVCDTASNYTLEFTVTSNQAHNSIYINGDDSTGTQNTGSAFTITVTNGEQPVNLWSTLAQTVTVAIGNPSISITAGNNKTFKFNPGPATQVGFDPVYASVTTDDEYDIALKAKDQYGNLATGFNNSSIYLTATPGATGDNLVTPVTAPIIFSSGEATYTVQNKRPETVLIGLKNSTLGSLVKESGKESFTLDVAVGAPHHFSLGSMPVGITADDTAAAILTVYSYDQWDNLSPTNDDVTIDASGSAKFDATNGSQYTFDFTGQDTLTTTLTDRVAETVSISLMYPTGGLSLVNAAKTMVVTHGLAKQIEFKTPLPTNAKTDVPAAVTLELYDDWGNLCTSSSGVSVDLTSVNAGGIATAPGGLGTKSFSNGKANYNITSTTRQDLTLNASATGLTVANDGQLLSFAWGTPASFAYTTTTGAAINNFATLTAEIRDNAGNWLREYSGTVEFTQASFTPSDSHGGSANPPSGFAQVTSSNGRFTINSITSQQAGTLAVKVDRVTGDGNPSSGTGSVTFTPGGATQMYIVPQSGNGIITAAEDVRIYALDDYWNVSSFSGSATIRINPGCGANEDCTGATADDGYFPPTTGTKTKTVNFSAGKADLQVRKESRGYTNLTVDSWSLINTGGEEFYFLPGYPVEYMFLDPGYIDSANFTDGCVDCHTSTDGPASIEIHAVDMAGSRSGTYNGSVEVYISNDPNGASAYGGKRVNFVQGKATVTIGDSAAENVTLALRDSQNADTTPNTLDVSATFNLKIGKGKVDRIELSDPPSILANSSTTLYVTAVDANGDAVTSYRGNFDLTSSSYVSGRGNFNIVDGVAEIEIGSHRAGTFALNLVDVSSTGLDFDSTSITVLPKDPNRIPLDCSDTTVSTEDRIKCWVYAIDSNHNYVGTWVGSLEIVVSNSNGDPSPDAEIYDAQTGGNLLWSADANNDGIYDGQGYIQNWNSNGATKNFYVRSKASEIVTIHTPNGAKAGLNLTGGAASPSINTGWSRARFFAPAEATKFEMTTPIANTTVGQTRTVTVNAYTASGNHAGSYDGYVYVRVANDPGEPSVSLSSGGLMHLINGVGTIDVTNTEPETVSITLERIDSTYDSIQLIPDLALTQSEDIVFEPDTPTQLAIEDPGTGTSGLPLSVTVSLKDANGNQAVNNTGSPISVNIASDNGDIAVSGSPVSIPVGAGSANFSLSSNVSATANITATHATLANAARAISFDVGDAQTIAHISTTYNSTDGVVTVELEALSAQGIRNTNYNGTFGVNILNAAADSIIANNYVNIANGVGSIEIKSTRAQTVDFNVFDYFATMNMPADLALVFTRGVPSRVTIATQPVAEVMKDTVFSAAGVFQITDDDGTVITSATDLISLQVYKGSGCSDAATGALSGTLSKAAVSGEATFGGLSYSFGEEISIKASSGSYAAACSNVTEVFGNLTLTASPGTSAAAGTIVTIEAKGGVQPVTFSMGQNNSGGSLGAPYTCSGNRTCVDYTLGAQGSSFDTIVGTDSAATSEFIAIMVNGAKLENTAGDEAFGAVELFIDQSESFTFTNNGSGNTGALSVTWTPDDTYAEDEALMWSINDVACAGADLANGGSCDVIIDFLGSSGPGLQASYSGTLTVEGATSGKASIAVSALLAPKLEASSTGHDFGSSASSNSFTYTNKVQGSVTDTLSGLLEQQAGDDCSGFTISANNCSTLDDSSSCQITVDFDPSAYGASGSYTCALTLDASNTEELFVPLTGSKP